MTTFVNLPLQNQCDNLNLTWDKAFSGEGDSVSCPNEGPRLFLLGPLVAYYITSPSSMETSLSSIKAGLQNSDLCSVFSWPLSREESLSCHICCDTGPLSLRSRPKDRSIQSHCTISTDYWGYILTRITTRGGNWVNTSTICKSSPPKTF